MISLFNVLVLKARNFTLSKPLSQISAESNENGRAAQAGGSEHLIWDAWAKLKLVIREQRVCGVLVKDWQASIPLEGVSTKARTLLSRLENHKGEERKKEKRDEAKV